MIATIVHLPTNIKKIREVSGETQKDFGKAMGVNEAKQKSYERGVVANPGLLYMDSLAKYSGFNQEDLVNKELSIDEIREKVKNVNKVNVVSPEPEQRPLSQEELIEQIRNKPERETLEQAILNMSEANMSNARSIERLISLLEAKQPSRGVKPPGISGEGVIKIHEQEKESQH
jgi:transcriptional regulator with XRE-family HTH domain